MKSDFLIILRTQADALRAKLHAINHPAPTRAPKPIDPAHTADAENAAVKLLASIDSEILRGPTAQEYEAQMMNTRPRPGETPEQTALRIKAEQADNPLVPHMQPER